MKRIKLVQHTLVVMATFMIMLTACNNGSNQQKISNQKDSASAIRKDSNTNKIIVKADTSGSNIQVTVNNTKTDLPTVEIYNFHITNRCASCIAIEEATTKTLNTYFAGEMKQGRIKRQILNVDEVLNKAIAEKYQAFGSGLFVTRVFKGKETTTDLTGDGFKYAKNKEEKFIEILKNQISAYLK